MRVNRRLSRRSLCVVTAGVLSTSLLTFAAPSFSTTETEVSAAITDTDDDGTLDAATTSGAAKAAATEDERVEDLSQRTENVSVYANENGTFTQRDFGGTVRVKQSGDWVPVDYTLAKQADGTYAPKASDLDITVDGGSAKEAARVIRDDGTSLAFTWPSNLPEPTVDGGVATYKISDATDLVVAVTGSGVTARIRLNKKPTGDDPVFQLGLRADGVDVDQTASGTLKITDEDGKTVGSTTQLSAWDASKDHAGDPANIVDLDANLDTTSTNGDVTQHTLDLTAPDGFLSDPDTEYPVIIDPDITMEKTRDTWVRSGDTTSHGSDFKLIAGKINPATTTNAGPTRSYLKFYNSIVENRTNIEIVSAEMGLWQYYAYDCGGRRMYVYPVGTPWNDTITWANKPATISGNGATNTTSTHGATGCGDGWTKVNLTAMAKAWNAGTVDMQGVRLSVDNENDSAWERRFCSMNPDASIGSCGTAARRPYFDVTYSVLDQVDDTELGKYHQLPQETLVKAVSVPSNSSSVIQVAGVAGIPSADGVSAARLSLKAASGAAGGRLIVHNSDEEAAPLSVGLVPGTSPLTTNTSVSETGSVTIRNTGSTPSTVTLTTLGWYDISGNSSSAQPAQPASGNIVISGTVANNGLPVPEGEVLIRAWPTDDYRASIPDDVVVPTWTIGNASTDTTGKFEETFPSSSLPPQFKDEDGAVNITLYATDHGISIPYNATVLPSPSSTTPSVSLTDGAVPTDANPLDVRLDLGTGEAADVNDPDSDWDDDSGDPVDEQVQFRRPTPAPSMRNIGYFKSASSTADPLNGTFAEPATLSSLRDEPLATQHARALALIEQQTGSAPTVNSLDAQSNSALNAIAVTPADDSGCGPRRTGKRFDVRERFGSVYNWSGAKVDWYQTSSSKHVLGTAISAGGGPWKARGSKSITKKVSASGKMIDVVNKTYSNRVNYERWFDSCSLLSHWEVASFGAFFTNPQQSVKKTWKKKCQPYKKYDFTRDSETAYTKEGGVELTGIASLNAQAGYDSGTKFVIKVRKKSWICGTSDAGINNSRGVLAKKRG